MANKQKRALKLQKQQQFDTRYRHHLNKNKEIRRIAKHPIKVIDLAYTRQLEPYNSYSIAINQLIRYLQPSKKEVKTGALFYQFLQILVQKRLNKKFFEQPPFITALFALAKTKKHWIRPITDWVPLKTRKIERQFAHLARFLLARYEVPTFMDKAFYTDQKTHIYWFMWIGGGYNIRKANSLPLPLTKKMAHQFLQAPPESTIDEALRWGQIIGMGGDAVLAKHLLATKLGQFTKHEDFWKTVIAFFIQHPMLDSAQLAPIIDYIFHQKFENQQIYRNGRRINQGAPHPNWSMKGRTVTSLLRDVNQWHRNLYKVGRFDQQTSWATYPIDNFVWKEGSEFNYKTYHIEQILNYGELSREGKTMKHCVASYVHSCLRGSCSIWSLSVEDMGGQFTKLITIELNRNRTIVQARGKYNALPKHREQQIIQRWCAMEGLTVSKWLGF